MSGRRRRGDGWDEGRRHANDDRRDSWGNGGVDDWTGRDRQRGEATARPDSSAGSAAGRGRDGYRGSGTQASGYDRGGYDNLRYDTGSGYGGGQSDAANGYAAGAYSGNGYGDSGYAAGRTAAGDTYQGSGYGTNGYRAGSYDATGYDATSYDVGYRGDSSTGAYGGDYGNDGGYGAVANGVNGRSASGFVPEFAPFGNDDAADGQPDTPRPIGRLSIYTLHDDKAAEFDRLAERAAEGVKAGEPDTLVFVIHVVPKAPMQRIIYEIYRDRAAFESHERQPHIQQFAADCASCVLATNIIDLRLKYAKVAALGAVPSESSSRSQANLTPRALESAAPVASFTPAEDQYATVNAQYAANGREQYSQSAQSAQYGNAGNGTYGTDNSQYGGTGAYSAATSAVANGGYSAANGANGYSSSNGYSTGNGYSSANGYQYANGAGYSAAANGYANGTTEYGNGTAGYTSGSSAAGYANGSSGSSYANGSSSAAGYANGSSAYANGAYARGSSYQNGNSYQSGAGYTAATPNGTGYSAAANGYGTAGYGESAGAQYGTGRYRELPSGSDAGSSGYSDGTGAYQADGGVTARGQVSEWDPRASQSQR